MTRGTGFQPVIGLIESHRLEACATNEIVILYMALHKNLPVDGKLALMCGRYVLRRIDAVRRAVDFMAPTFEEFTEHPRFNIAPSQIVPVVRLSDRGRELLPMRWGFIASWTMGKPKIAPINAKCETVAASGMFRQAFQRRRCLVPADGFYEWKGAKPPKQPFFIHRKDDAPFAFAGLWERWKPVEGAEPVDTFTILTTTPNELMAPIHNRMPVIIDASDYVRWLEQGDGDLLKPYAAGKMEAFPVSTKVNRPAYDAPDCVEPIAT
jgi:putative SOS response-associated peptidase YedK